jgi:hypothetical protein
MHLLLKNHVLYTDTTTRGLHSHNTTATATAERSHRAALDEGGSHCAAATTATDTAERSHRAALDEGGSHCAAAITTTDTAERSHRAALVEEGFHRAATATAERSHRATLAEGGGHRAAVVRPLRRGWVALRGVHNARVLHVLQFFVCGFHLLGDQHYTFLFSRSFVIFSSSPIPFFPADSLFFFMPSIDT